MGAENKLGNLGIVFSQLKESKKAVELFNEAIKINESPYGNLFLLIAFTLIYLVTSPFISALLVRIAIGR